MITEELLADWRYLTSAERERFLFLLRDSVEQRLKLPAGSLKPTQMQVYAAFREGCRLAVHAAADLTECLEIQPGSDGEEHLVYSIDAMFTLSGVLIFEDIKMGRYPVLNEHRRRSYDPDEILSDVVQKAAVRFLTERSGEPPVEIRFLALSTAELAETGEFYRDVLQLPRLVEGNDHSVFKAGSTHLMFEAVQDSSRRPFYHFAFDIPRNQLSQAAEWLSRRVTLLERDGQTRIPFPDWNATGLYFHDPSGNIVELIARRNLPNDLEGEFTSDMILRISEIGWPVDSLASEPDFGLPVWRNYGSFKALGSETGLLLLVPDGRPWTPTARPAEAHPTGVVFTLREPHGESRLWRRFDR